MPTQYKFPAIPWPVLGPYLRNRGLLWTALRLWLSGALGTLDTTGGIGPRCTLLGREVDNPLGLAAGLDRTGLLLRGVAHAGFGFSEVGSVTPVTASRVRHRIIQARDSGHKLPVGVNIRPSPRYMGGSPLSDYLLCCRVLLPVADYLVLNATSPKRCRGDRTGVEWSPSLLSAVLRERDWLAHERDRRVPLMIKISLDTHRPERQLEGLQKHRDAGLDGVVLVSPRDADEALTCQLLQAARSRLGEMSIVSVGGLYSARQVLGRIQAGATAVQLFSAAVQRGPSVIRSLLEQMADADRSGTAA